MFSLHEKEFKSKTSKQKLEHLIEEIFEHRNTNSFKLSVRLFYLGKRIRIPGYNLMRINPRTQSYSLIRNINEERTTKSCNFIAMFNIACFVL